MTEPHRGIVQPATPLQLDALGAVDGRPAVVEPGRGRVSYADLDQLANRVAGRLRQIGVEPTARVGLYTRRSCDAIALMLGSLRAGCTYVPVDPGAPAERNAEILAECGVRATIVEERFEAGFREATRRHGAAIDIQRIGTVGLGRAIHEWAAQGSGSSRASPIDNATSASALACILYTSGSTGRHKGWMMSQAAIAALVRWGRSRLGVGSGDVFANHAPFNFGMSLFDIYSSLTCGATLVLLPDEIRQFASHVVDLLGRERVTILFATPAILSRIAALDDLEQRDLSTLRLIVFGGEVFPAPPLQTLLRRLPHPRYFNCWGSTETNIGTCHELPVATQLDGPPPIGRPCEHYEARIVGFDGELVAAGTLGELQLRGAGLTTGYLNQTALTAERLLAAADGGPPWYRTCDLVIELPSGDLRYAGRIGRMVKIRGYRVEPGEIETRLYEHPQIKEVSVVAIETAQGVQLVAHLSGARLSVVALKEFCAVKLPPYMIPERFVFHDALPRTARGKIDFESLRANSLPDLNASR